MQTNCIKCSYPRDEPKGERVCRKCQKPENVAKADWGVPKIEIVRQTLEVIETSPKMTSVGNGISADEVGSPCLVPSPLPAHSRLGASSAKRWMHCSGSPALISQLKIVEEDSEYAAEGTQAHALASHCLDNDLDAWEALGNYNLLKFEDAGCVQEYLDYVRSRPGRRDVEIKMHRPELHELFYGTIDCAIYAVTGQQDLVLEVVDFKFGAGVYVPVERCEQLMYYAVGYIMDDPTFYPDSGRVRLTISQPRMVWADTIRSWDTTVGDIKEWLWKELLPAMHRHAEDLVFSLGDWCQFCPAKLVCPAMTEAYKVFIGQPVEALTTITDEALGERYVASIPASMYIKALKDEVHRRLMDRTPIPGAKLVAQKTDRVWKDGADEAAAALFGPDRLTVQKLLSPAAMEKLPGGKAFVSEHAYKPEAGFTVALADDVRKGVERPTGSQIWANIPVDTAA